MQEIDSRERALDEKMKATAKEDDENRRAARKTVHAERAWSKDKAKEWQDNLARERRVHETVLASRDTKITELEATIKSKEKELKEIHSQHKLQLRELKKQHDEALTSLRSANRGIKRKFGQDLTDTKKANKNQLNTTKAEKKKALDDSLNASKVARKSMEAAAASEALANKKMDSAVEMSKYIDSLRDALSLRECKKLLDMWRDVTERMFPSRQDLLDKIPSSSDLTLAKLSKDGQVMTDTCSTARKFRRLIIDEIKKIAKEEGYSEDENLTLPVKY